MRLLNYLENRASILREKAIDIAKEALILELLPSDSVEVFPKNAV